MDGMGKLNYALKTQKLHHVNAEPAESHGFQTTTNIFIINAQI